MPAGVVGEVTIRSVEVPLPPDESTISIGVRVMFRPVGELEATRFTVPVNPLTLAIMMVEDTVPPWVMIRLLGLAVTVKSGIITAGFTVRENVPLLAP